MRCDPEKLRREMALRGWNQNDLAKESGISQPTVSAACRGDWVAAPTARVIQEAFDRVPPTLGDLVVSA